MLPWHCHVPSLAPVSALLSTMAPQNAVAALLCGCAVVYNTCTSHLLSLRVVSCCDHVC